VVEDMSEVIYLSMVVFVAYVAYTVLTDKNGSSIPTHFEQAESPVESAVADVSVAAAIDSTVVSIPLGGELKNPKTGEVAKIPNNYRFGKYWIKEALVAEGLLDRVYKNNELDNVTNAKVQAAMAALKNIDKYKV
jgi:hypothetical protein